MTEFDQRSDTGTTRTIPGHERAIHERIIASILSPFGVDWATNLINDQLPPPYGPPHSRASSTVLGCRKASRGSALSQRFAAAPAHTRPSRVSKYYKRAGSVNYPAYRELQRKTLYDDIFIEVNAITRYEGSSSNPLEMPSSVSGLGKSRSGQDTTYSCSRRRWAQSTPTARRSRRR